MMMEDMVIEDSAMEDTVMETDMLMDIDGYVDEESDEMYE
jgi:hypothetical protein